MAEYNEGHYQWQGDKPVHKLYHLYNAAGERVQVTTDRFSQWGGRNILYKRNVHEGAARSITHSKIRGILRISMNTLSGGTIPRRDL